MPIIIVDTTAIIGLARVGKLHLLQEILGDIIIPQQVFQEVAVQGKGRPGEKEVKSFKWIQVKDIKEPQNVQLLKEYGLGGGEAEVLILALESGANIVVTDDDLAFETAITLGFKVIQTVEVVILAKDKGLISSVGEVLDEMREKGFWIGDEVYLDALRKTGEL